MCKICLRNGFKCGLPWKGISCLKTCQYYKH